MRSFTAIGPLSLMALASAAGEALIGRSGLVTSPPLEAKLQTRNSDEPNSFRAAAKMSSCEPIYQRGQWTWEHWIPEAVVGRLIGKGGEGIKSLQVNAEEYTHRRAPPLSIFRMRRRFMA